MSYINQNWKNIARGHTAFCIFGGPSVKQTKNLETLIFNNFTVTVNHNIKLYPNSDLYITGDNIIAREYFEDKDFFTHKFIGGKLLSTQSNFRLDTTPIWVETKNHIINQNPNLIKIITCQNLISYNINFSTGQLYEYKGLEYAKYTPNTHICLEIRDKNTNEVWPILSPTIPESVELYGKDPLKLPAGGNISGVVFQLLHFMGFDKIIAVGYGDNGESAGYKPNTQFTWSNEEIHALVIHHKIWGDKLKTLHGGEICKEYTDMQTASYSELENNPIKKNQLIQKLLEL